VRSWLCNGYLTRVSKPVRLVRSELLTACCWGFSLMEYDTESTGTGFPVFSRNVVPSWAPQPLKSKALWYFKMSGNTYLVTKHHIQEGPNPHPQFMSPIFSNTYQLRRSPSLPLTEQHTLCSQFSKSRSWLPCCCAPMTARLCHSPPLGSCPPLLS